MPATRKAGLDVLSDFPWRTHFCLFYETKEDLIDVLVPYFKAGLENNEFCMWITSDPLNADDAERSLGRAVENLDDYIEKGQIEILDYSQWYTKSGVFEGDKVLRSWLEKEKQAAKRGFDGLRLTRNTLWLEKSDWEEFAAYEADVHRAIGYHRMKAICTYPLDKWGMWEVAELVTNHRRTFVMRRGEWKEIQSGAHKQGQESQEFGRRILQISNNCRDTMSLFKELVAEVKDFSGCAAVGLRILDEKSNILHQAYEGFSQRFYESECPLSVKPDECMCIKVIRGETDSNLPYYTERGSLYINGTTRFLATVSEEEKGQTRTVCNEFGYESVAVVPLRLGERILGSIHMADPEENKVSLEMVKAVEEAAMQSSMAIQRARTEEAIRGSQREYKQLYENAPVGYHETDVDGRIVRVNRTEAEMLGYTTEEMLGRSVFDFIAEVDGETVKEGLRKQVAREQLVGSFEQTYLRKDGREVRVAIEGRPILDEAGNVTGIRSVLQNITERKRLEEDLHQAQKMEAIGQLASGLAHNINNSLSVIIGNLSLAKISNPDKTPGFVDEALEASEHAAWLVREVLAFGRRSRIKRKLIDLNHVVDEVSHLARKTYDPRIDIRIHKKEGLPKALADPAQMNSVLMNLCLNARDAIEKSLQGEVAPEWKRSRFVITLQTQTAVIDQKYCETRSDARPGRFLVLSVSDTGCGMDAEVQRRIFEPFFTTKGFAEGTGLGLASAYGIMKQHDGWIDFSTELGKGTTFEIYLPVAEEETHKDETECPEKLRGGKETVLLLDDEEPILQVGKAILERFGYTVLLASDGREGLNTYLEAQDRIDLIILDLWMPRLSGREVLEQLRVMARDVKVIVSTGHLEERQEQILNRFNVAGYVSKPYHAADLALAVREVLDRS